MRGAVPPSVVSFVRSMRSELNVSVSRAMHSKSLKLLPIWPPLKRPGWRQAQRVMEIRERNTCHLSCPVREIFYGCFYPVMDEWQHCKSTPARNILCLIARCGSTTELLTFNGAA